MSQEEIRIEKQKSSPKRKTFVFLSGNLALDLVNTELMERGEKRDLLPTPQEATRWWKLAQVAHPSASEVDQEWNIHHLETLLRLREELRALFISLAEHRQVNAMNFHTLNQLLEEGSYMFSFTPEAGISVRYQRRNETASQALIIIALAALHLCTQQDLKRLHACQNERCILLFYDTTKSATRHWCSVACTNRARSIQHYQQTREALLEA